MKILKQFKMKKFTHFMNHLLSAIIGLLLFVDTSNAQQIVSPTSGPANNNATTLSLNKRKDLNYGEKTSTDPRLKPFFHGVASGDPLTDRVIIWTRVTPDSVGSVIQGTWRVSSDTLLSDTVAMGNFTTDAAKDYTVKIDVTGLSSNTTYYYFFSALNANSLIGRTRTAPSLNEASHLKFGVVSCSNFEAGFFNALGRVAERNDLDAVIHLGDYIYEYATRIFGDTNLQNNQLREHDSLETVNLNLYRSRYSLYRLDEDLRRAHQQHPFINIWDDHESANDSWTGGAENHDSTEGNWNNRLDAAKQAFFEWIPIRDNSADTIYRTLQYGNLVDLILLDTRLEGREEQINDVTSPALYSPTRTMLGNDQKSWFKNALSNSTAKWKVVGNQVIFSEFHVGWAAQAPATPAQTESIFLDIWDGYPAERLNIIQHLETDSIDNVIFLTGDFHSTFAFDVADSVTNPSLFYAPTTNYNPSTGAGSVAVEFATPSISSANFDENVGPATAAVFELQINNPLPTTTLNIPNPHMKYVDLDQHGYFILDLKDDSAQANYYFVDRLDTVSSIESFGQAWYTDNGQNHLKRANAASALKTIQQIPAPVNPPNIGIVGLEEHSKEENVTVLGIYPNPANFQFFVQFSLSKSEEIRLDLFDLSGKYIKNLNNSKLDKGVYNLSFNKNDLPSGIYFLRFTSESSVISKKIVIAN